MRRLLAGETLDFEGEYVTSRSIRLAHPPAAKVPVLTGAVGPKSLRLSGRIADGTIMSVLASPAYIEELHRRASLFGEKLAVRKARSIRDKPQALS